MALTPQWLDELRSRTILSALIGRSIKVTKAGREYKACCPFHNEKTPSFTINDEKGFYHCFGCSAHGDAIRWMTDYRNLPFMDAVKELAAQAGMEVPASDPQAAKKAEQRAGLHDVMAAAQKWFVQQFQSIEGAAAREYLQRRGIREDIIRQFGFGFAPDSRGGLKKALDQFGEPALIEAGLLIAVDDKEPYDRFRGRLMIPIRDRRGRVIAFGGRIMGDGEPKYLNSPDTPLFDKGRTLYNLDLCGPAARQADQVIVVEGYMDVIALSQAGFGNSVAPLGTALTETQLAMLWRMAEKPLLCFDGDAAGQKAAMRAALRALPHLQPGYSLQFITLPPGVDPDDLLKTEGPTAFRDLINKSVPLVDFLWQAEFGARPLVTPEDRAGLKQRLGLHVANIADSEIRRHYADAFREKLDSVFSRNRNDNIAARPFRPGQNGMSSRKGRGNSFSPFIPPATEEAHGIGRNGVDILAQGILTCLLRFPRLINEHQDSLIDYQPKDRAHAKLLAAILDSNFSKEGLDTGGILTILGEDLYNVALMMLRADSNLFMFSRASDENSADNLSQISKELGEAIKLVKRRPALENAVRQAEAKAAMDLTDENIAELIRLKNEKMAFDRQMIEIMRRDAETE